MSGSFWSNVTIPLGTGDSTGEGRRNSRTSRCEIGAGTYTRRLSKLVLKYSTQASYRSTKALRESSATCITDLFTALRVLIASRLWFTSRSPPKGVCKD